MKFLVKIIGYQPIDQVLARVMQYSRKRRGQEPA